MDSLAAALYVRTDDLLMGSPQLAPWRPVVGITPQLSDAELVTLPMMQAMLGYTSEARWLRHARVHLRHLFPYLPKQPGYNKRLRKAAGLIRHVMRELATAVRLLRQPHSLLPGTSAAPAVHAGRAADRVRADRGEGRRTRDTPRHLATEPTLVTDRPPGQTLIGDKNYFGREFESQLAGLNIELLRPARKGEAERAGSQLFKPLRQVIESINETFKGQLDLERHRGRTPGGVMVRVLSESSR